MKNKIKYNVLLIYVLLLICCSIIFYLIFQISVLVFYEDQSDKTIFLKWQELLFGKNIDQDIQNLNTYLQSIISSFTFTFAVAIALIYTMNKEKESKKHQALQEIMRMASQLYDLDFYTKVICPSWEVASKWRYWSGEDGDEYRYHVIAGTYLYMDDSMRYFNTIEEANSLPYQSFIRDHPHYLVYGVSNSDLKTSPGAVISSGVNVVHELAEHNAITIWFGFWVRLVQLEKQELVDRLILNETFKDFYIHFYVFFTEYRRVVKILTDQIESQGYQSMIYSRSRENNLNNLEKIFEIKDIYYEPRSPNLSADKFAESEARKIWGQHLLKNQGKTKLGVWRD